VLPQTAKLELHHKLETDFDVVKRFEGEKLLLHGSRIKCYITAV